jgi:predicted CoA-binding protein
MTSILSTARTIAVVGLSPKSHRDSNMVARYMQSHGYRIIPVNPGHDEILGERCYPNLAAVPEPIDIVDIFRNSDAALAPVEEAVKLSPKPKAIWLQFGVINDDAAKLAADHGIPCFMDHCLKVDHAQAVGR